MKVRMSLKLHNVLLVLLALMFVLAVRSFGAQEKSQAAPASGGASSQKVDAYSATDPSQYVGAETCKTCHDEIYQGYEKSPHYVTMLDTKKGPEWHGCEACHGPGKEHVDGGGDKTKIFTFKNVSAKDISARCLGCHQYGEEHSNFARSAHARNNVSCIDCHSPHKAAESQFLMKTKQPQLCYTCHIETKQQFTRTFHHRVNEGLVKCGDCHNPHGGFETRQLRATASQDTTCFKCHADKAGPFVFEHQAVKIEGCIACHTPHGSSNPRLLKRSQVNLLCLECHSLTVDAGAPAIPTFHKQDQKYQACTLCHVAIHGSNSSNVFFKP